LARPFLAIAFVRGTFGRDRPARHDVTLSVGRSADSARVFGSSAGFLSTQSVPVPLPSPVSPRPHRSPVGYRNRGGGPGCGRRASLSRGGERRKRQCCREANPNDLTTWASVAAGVSAKPAARAPHRIPPSGRHVQAANIAAISSLQIGLPGWMRNSPALASSHADVRLYRPQTFTSKRSSIMTLFQALTNVLTKRL
jgi:hypothetical protein